jgi:DNA-binding beta-propeller fold protein YncE
MRRFLAIVSVVASGLGAAGAGDQDYFLSVPSQGAIHRVDAITLQATPFLTGLNTPFYGFHDASGNLYIPDHLFGAILRIDPLGIPSLLTAGGYLTAPLALIADPTGGVLATDKYQNTVVHVDDLGNQTLLHDDISSNGLLFGPAGLDFDLAGNLYVSNNTGNTIVRIDPANQLTLWSDSPLIKTPGGIAIDGSGNMFVAMYDGNNIVRFRVDTAEAEVFAEDLSIMIRPNDLKLSRGGHLLTTTRLGNLVSIDATGKPTELFKGPGWSDVLGVSVPEDWKSCTGTATTYGQGLAGAGGFVPRLCGIFSPCPGESFALEWRNVVGGSATILALGTQNPSTPAFGGTLLVSPLAIVLVPMPGTPQAPGEGDLVIPFTLPNDPTWIGAKIRMQALCADAAAPFGVSMSNGLELTIGA